MTDLQKNTTKNQDNIALILYRLDEMKIILDNNAREQLRANERSSAQHKDNSVAIVKLEGSVGRLDVDVKKLRHDFEGHFDDSKKKPLTTDWAKVLVGIFGALATLIAAYVAIKGV